MSEPIRLLIIDDHCLFRETLAQALSSERDLCVVAHHATSQDAFVTLSAVPVDIVLLDFDLQGERGSTIIAQAAETDLNCRFIVVTASICESDAVWLIQHGVSGIFLKESPLTSLISAIRTVAAGGKWLDQPFLQLVMKAVKEGAAAAPCLLFTSREQTTLRYLVEGCTNKEIATALRLSEAAVKATVQRLFDKTGVRTRGHLVRAGLQKYQNYL
jgi:two-component system nitrate/nitrite response regulator NarL